MQRGLGGTVFEPMDERRDRELTLGPAILVALACGLLTLCGLCFVFGYAMGHRGAESANAGTLPSPGAALMAQPAGPQSKPAAGQTGAPTQKAAAPTDQVDSSDADSAAGEPPIPVPVSTTPASSAAANSGASSVRTALTGQPAAAQTASGSGGGVAPALAQPGGIVVQIAAVSHPEDAEVLVGALRKHGYAVTARRDPTDGLLHVQIGPFANRNDAFAMRQKLLNDGYNAIVQP